MSGLPLKDALAAFTIETNLEPQHRRLMDAGHARVPYEASRAASLPDALRPGLAEMWRARMLSEHRSVGVFALYVLDLLGAGAPAEMLSSACRASLDEVRHAEIFARLAALYSGQPESPEPGIPVMPDDASVPMRDQVAREALHLSVFAESYSAVLLGDLLHHAKDPAVRAALGVVLADEVHHARMGWATLELLFGGERGDELRARVQAELLATMDALVKAMFGDPSKLPEPSLEEALRPLARDHGWMSARDEWALFQATIADVWVPGLAALGVDAQRLRDWYPEAAVVA